MGFVEKLHSTKPWRRVSSEPVPAPAPTPTGFQGVMLSWVKCQPDETLPSIWDHALRTSLADIYNSTPDRAQADEEATVLLQKVFGNAESALQWQRHQYLVDLKKHGASISQSMFRHSNEVLRSFSIDFQPRFRLLLHRRNISEPALKEALAKADTPESQKGIATLLLGDVEIAESYLQYTAAHKSLDALALHGLSLHMPRQGNYAGIADMEGRRLENQAIRAIAPLTREGEQALRIKLRDMQARLMKDVIEITGQSQLGVQ